MMRCKSTDLEPTSCHHHSKMVQFLLSRMEAMGSNPSNTRSGGTRLKHDSEVNIASLNSLHIHHQQSLDMHVCILIVLNYK